MSRIGYMTFRNDRGDTITLRAKREDGEWALFIEGQNAMEFLEAAFGVDYVTDLLDEIRPYDVSLDGHDEDYLYESQRDLELEKGA